MIIFNACFLVLKLEKLNFIFFYPIMQRFGDVTAGGQILEIFEKWLHFWIPRPQITKNASFWVSNPNRSRETVFWPYFTLYAQIWCYDVTAGGQMLEMFEKWLHFWIPSPQITQNGRLWCSNPNTSWEIE